MRTGWIGPVTGATWSGGAALVLLATAPTPAAAVSVLRSAAVDPDPMQPLVALVAVVAWSLAGWLLLTAALSVGSRLPGAAGRLAGTVVRRVAPAGVRRLVEVALGLTVVVGALGATPAAAGPAIPPTPPAATASLDWPVAAAAPAATPAATPPVATSERVMVAPVVVRPGDSLWSVAAAHLPAGASDAHIAQAWPSWWAANRAAVGADPDLIHPGLELHPPTRP